MIDTSQRGTTAGLSQWQWGGGWLWRTGIEAKLSIPSVTYGEQKEERLCEKFARWLVSNGRRGVGGGKRCRRGEASAALSASGVRGGSGGGMKTYFKRGETLQSQSLRKY